MIADDLGERAWFRAIGGWDGDELASFASWEIDRPNPGWIWIGTLAVATAYRRGTEGEGQHIGLQTKEFVLEAAVAEGFHHAFSEVDGGNEAMLKLNEKLGAKCVPWPWPNNDTITCTIRLY